MRPTCRAARSQSKTSSAVPASPKTCFRTLIIGSRRVDAVIEHPLVRAVTLTGSGPAGRAVARKAGEMLKKTVLELGGSDPYLVLEDADFQLAASKTLPLGSSLKVTNLKNGRSAQVKINDRGPAVRGRSLDLSPAAAQKIGLTKSGVARVEITPVSDR
jgi:hypothetical protein